MNRYPFHEPQDAPSYADHNAHTRAPALPDVVAFEIDGEHVTLSTCARTGLAIIETEFKGESK